MGLSNFTGNDNNSNNNTGGFPPVLPLIPNGGIPDSSNIDIDSITINYNNRFKNAGPTLFRDNLIYQTMSVLIGKNKPNALLVGAAGVGKTKIVEDIAWRLANNNPTVPDKLQGMTIYELPLSNLVSGSSLVGQLEEKLNGIIDYMSDKKNKAILFIDEIHQLVGKSYVYEKIAQILKPALARGDIRVIGATTLQEANGLSDDPALSRRFSRLIVDEFSREQTIEILKQAKASFMSHYNNRVAIDDNCLETVAILADQYKTAGGHRPDTALTLLDRSIGDAIIARKILEENLKNDPTALAAVQAMPFVPVSENQIKTTAIKLMTGNNKKDEFDLNHLAKKLSVIKGQDHVVPELLNIIYHNDLDLFPKKTPLSLLFTGSSGVGKTEVTKIIAEELTGKPPIILNMTEYHSPASINRIIGSPAGYVGSDSNAELPFDCLESNPYQIILLDEFEKGDESVQTLFMQALDEGTLKTNRNKEIDFSKAIIIATTNAAHTERKKLLGFGVIDDEDARSKQEITHDLSKWFKTELLNRFTHIFEFHSISKEIYETIITERYAKELARIRSEKSKIVLPDTIPDDELEVLVNRTYVEEFGARPAYKAVREYIESKLPAFVIQSDDTEQTED